jgi:hypothetical protein
MEGGGVREQQFRRPTSAIRIFCGRPRFDQCEDDPGDERRELSQSVLAPLGLKTAMSDLVPKRSPVLTKPPCGLDVAAQRRHEIRELHPIVARPASAEGLFQNNWIHHGKNPAHHTANLGSRLTIWDRLFETYVDPETAGEVSFGIEGRSSPARLALGL